MLPFLKPKKQSTGIATVYRAPDEAMGETPSDSDGLESAAEDLKRAIEAGDIKGMAAALKAAFEICDSAPHVEGEHLEE